MNMKNVLIVIGLMLILAGCSQGKSIYSNSDLVDSVKITQEIEPSVEMYLNPIKMSKDMWKVEIKLKNPQAKEIRSVRTWLAYNPQGLKATKINTADGQFDIAAPSEEKIDNEKGLIQLGLSKINNQKVSLTEIKVAEIIFEKIGKGAQVIDFYNFQEDTTSNVSVNIELDGLIYNIVKQPNSPGIVLQ